MKVLVIRLSSIGDVVLATPVPRMLKSQQGVEVHFLIKNAFRPLIDHNPYIDQVWDYEEEDLTEALKEEKFDFIIDLHNNMRSFRLRSSLHVTSLVLNKKNVHKWLMVNFKAPFDISHIVSRYIDTLSHFNIKADQKGLDYFFPPDFSYNIPYEAGSYIAVAVGAAHSTKIPPESMIAELTDYLQEKFILIGGERDHIPGELIAAQSQSPVLNLAGKLTLHQSAWVIKNCRILVTGDTGMMHIGSALNKKMLTIWGNTVPEFGMFPYSPENEYIISEIDNLSCRPCSKIGYEKCPLGHFKCMRDQMPSAWAEAILNLRDQGL